MPRLNSDIYALGMMLVQGVTGFSIDDILSSKTAPLVDERGNYIWQEYAPQVSPRLQEIVSKTIEYDFRDRYQTATEVLLAIDFPPIKSRRDKIKQFFNNLFI